MSLAILFPHPPGRSLGSDRRVRELSSVLSKRLGIPINIYTPFIKEPFNIGAGISVKPIPSPLSSSLLAGALYHLSRRIYYDRRLCRAFLVRYLLASGGALSERLCPLLERDGALAIQAEQDVSLPLALQAGEALDIPVIADLHNIITEELVAAGTIRPGERTYGLLQELMADWLSQADLVCVVSQEMAKYVVSRYGIRAQDVVVALPGGRPRVSETILLRRRRDKVVYAGMLSYREHVDLFVRSAPYVKAVRPLARFYATARGEDMKRIVKLDKKLGSNITFFWFPDERRFFRFLSSCSLAVLPSSSDMARKMGTPIKLLDYMSVGLPVVANAVGGWSRIIADERIGLLVSDEPRDFADAILELLGDDELRLEMAKRALKLVSDKYSWDRTAEPLVRAYVHMLI